MGGVTKTVTNGVTNAVKSVADDPRRALFAGATGGLSEFTQSNPFGAPINSPLGNLFHGSSGNPIPGPFSLDQGQFNADRAAIAGEGDKQYAETLKGIDENTGAQQKLASDTFKQLLPGLAEDYNAGHLLNSTGYGAEAARQGSMLANQVAADASSKKYEALAGKQGFGTGALQRGLSMEDFINQANVAKTIGAQMAPLPQNGKQNFGTVAQGAGALAPWAKVGKQQ